MIIIKFIWICLVLCLCPLLIRGQQTMSIINVRADSMLVTKEPVRALGEILGINLGVWAFDRYLLESDFSYISKRTIENNLKRGFVWDSDLFGTNFILHPYHGSLYFNAARVNGMNFYESIPFTLAGSLTWEYVFENELPSKNDIMATTVGGIMLGEMTYRLSDRILDNSATGVNRVVREIFAGVVSPMNGLNRLLSGDAWKRSPYSIPDRVPIDLNVDLGVHLLKPEMDAGYLPYGQFGFRLEYNPDMTECEKPYDWFELGLWINMRPGAFYINRMHASGLLWNRVLSDTERRRVDFGVFQHLDYRDSPEKVYRHTPYRIAQVLAVGPGIRYKTKVGAGWVLDGKAFLTGVGLGASLSDYYWVVDRDYSFGSGFSSKVQLKVSELNSGFRFGFTADHYNLFTWKGYEANRNLHAEDLKMLNVQGDKGYANFTSLETEIGYQSGYGWNVNFVPSYLFRSTHYSNFPSVNYSTWEFVLKVGYNFRI